MAITRDLSTRQAGKTADAIGRLLHAFNRAADGHDMRNVMEASANMLMAVIVRSFPATGKPPAEFEAYARALTEGVVKGAVANFQRKSQSTDVVIPEGPDAPAADIQNPVAS